MAPFNVVIADQPGADHGVESAAFGGSWLEVDQVGLAARRALALAWTARGPSVAQSTWWTER